MHLQGKSCIAASSAQRASGAGRGSVRACWPLLTIAFFLLLGYAPSQGGSIELQIGVDYARVRLPSRAPVALDLDLPPGEYFIQPPSLGYFTTSREFIFTAEEPRGLIYGRVGDRVLAIELQTPARAEEFMADYLARIREQVAAVNVAENELLLTRQRFAGASSRTKQLASIPLALRSEELAAGALDEWSEKCFAEPGVAHETPSAVAQSCRERSELKRMYYTAQMARIDLTLRNFDLQMALARMPTPRFADVLGAGNQQFVRDTALANLAERRADWDRRREQLQQQRELDEAQLEVRPEIVLLAGTPVILPMSAPSITGAQPADPAQGLRRLVLEQRLQLIDAELASLDEADAELERAIAYVEHRGMSDNAVLPRTAVGPMDFAPVRVGALPRLALIENTDSQPLEASGVLLKLARNFEADAPSPLELPGRGGVLQVDCAPDELAYGLVVVDRCRRQEASAGPEGAQLGGMLEGILERPGDYEAAGCDLGYIAFMRWYAGIEPATPISAPRVARRVGRATDAAVERLRLDAE